MARICDYRMCYLLLTAALTLPDPSLAAGAIHARSSSSDGRNEAIGEKIQHLLSNQQIEDLDAIKLIFKEGDNALPTLLTALREGKNVERASSALATLGGPRQREILRRVIATQKDPEKKSLMASFLAGALVEPSSDEEWHFLETCLRGYKDESTAIASFYATLALGNNASPKALHLLQAVLPPDQSQAPDNETAQAVSQAIRWIQQRSSKSREVTPAETGPDSERIKRIVLENAFYTEEKREDLSVEDIVFTREKNRVLVSVEIDLSASDLSYAGPAPPRPKVAHGYDIVLERSSGKWKIVGVWFTWAS